MCNVAVCRSVIVVGFFSLRRGLFLICWGSYLSCRENFRAMYILYGGNKRLSRDQALSLAAPKRHRIYGLVVNSSLKPSKKSFAPPPSTSHGR